MEPAPLDVYKLNSGERVRLRVECIIEPKVRNFLYFVPRFLDSRKGSLMSVFNIGIGRDRLFLSVARFQRPAA